MESGPLNSLTRYHQRKKHCLPRWPLDITSALAVRGMYSRAPATEPIFPYAPSGLPVTMPQGNAAPQPDASIKDKTRSGFNTGEAQVSGSARVPPRMSVLAAIKLPSLRRFEVGSNVHTRKTPLLTLKLSSHSFLDSTLKDDLSSGPLYTIRTVGVTTTITRADPWEGSTKTADIKWPKILPARRKGKNVPEYVLVQLKGSRWKGSESFLKPSTSKNGPRKFNIPHYSHSMKWEKHDGVYWCTTSPVKGPIATFDPSVDTLPGRLTVYETLHDKYDTSPMFVHHGVSILLLDYLLVTAILLVTDVQEWMVVQSGRVTSPSSPTDLNPNAGLQWRKVAHGEPLFPKLSPVGTSQATSTDFNDNVATPTSQEQLAKIVHGDPLFPRLQHATNPQLSFSSGSEDEGGDSHSFSEVPRTRSPSPLFYPSSNASAPSDIYVHPSFYPDHELPPVPPLPASVSQARSSSSSSIRSQRLRALPIPPSHSPLSESSHSRTSLARSLTDPKTWNTGISDTIGPADPSLWKRRPSEPIINRSRSMSRPLPRAPATGNVDPRDRSIRRIQSHTRINDSGTEKPWLSTSPPPLPVPPSNPRTPRTGRSLPPTPLDLVMGRTVGGLNVVDGPPVRKSFESEEEASDWMRTPQNPSSSRPSFDQPPPAYTLIDFHVTPP